MTDLLITCAKNFSFFIFSWTTTVVLFWEANNVRKFGNNHQSPKQVQEVVITVGEMIHVD